MSEAITVSISNEIAVVTFTRPDLRNPISTDVARELIEIVDDIELKKCTKVVFTGSDGVFASGADLREVSRLDQSSARGFAEMGQLLMSKIENLPLTIAAIDGFCFGGALDLALSCSARIASDRSVFCHPGVSLGIMTGWGGTQKLPRLIGGSRAMEMLLTARQVSAAEALSFGLVDMIAENVLRSALNKLALR